MRRNPGGIRTATTWNETILLNKFARQKQEKANKR